MRARVRQTQIVKLTSLIMMQLALSCNILSRSLSPLQLALARCICALDPPFGWFLIQHTHTPVSLPVIDIDSLVMSRSRSSSRSLSASACSCSKRRWRLGSPPGHLAFITDIFHNGRSRARARARVFCSPKKESRWLSQDHGDLGRLRPSPRRKEKKNEDRLPCLSVRDQGLVCCMQPAR